MWEENGDFEQTGKLANWQTWQSGSLPHNGHIQANVPDAVFISSQDKTGHHLAVDMDSN